VYAPAARPFNVPAAGGLLLSGRGILRGFSAFATAGTVSVRLWDNSVTNSGQELVVFRMTLNSQVLQFPGLAGIPFEQGLFVDVVGAGLEMIVHASMETRAGDALAVYDDTPRDLDRLTYEVLAEHAGGQ
jgi:hypothetical protein